MSLACMLLGHKVNELAPYPICDRCGAQDYNCNDWNDFEGYGLRAPIVKLRRWKNERLNSFEWKHRSLRNWITCSDCGWHFGRHDPRVDHVPF